MNTEKSLPVLYSFRRCPYAMRARLALFASEMQVELREIVLRGKPPSMLELSPKGTVPVLLLADGTVIDESYDVMLHALGTSDPLNLLVPQAGTLNQAISLIAQNDGPFKAELDHYKYPNRYENVDRDVARNNASKFLFELNEMLIKNNGFLLGSQLSIADIAILPFVRQFANVDYDWFKEQKWVELTLALETFVNSPLFLSIMNKYPVWKEGDEITLFGGISAKGKL